MADGRIEIPVVPKIEDLELSPGAIDGKALNKWADNLAKNSGELFSDTFAKSIDLSNVNKATKSAVNKYIKDYQKTMTAANNASKSVGDVGAQSSMYLGAKEEWERYQRKLASYNKAVDNHNKSITETVRLYEQLMRVQNTNATAEQKQEASRRASALKSTMTQEELRQVRERGRLNERRASIKNMIQTTEPQPRDYMDEGLRSMSKAGQRSVLKDVHSYQRAAEEAERSGLAAFQALSKNPYTEQYAQKLRELEKIMSDVTKLQDSLARKQASGSKINVGQVNYDKSKIQSRADSLQSQMSSMVKNDQTFAVKGIGDSSAELSNLQAKFNNIKDSISGIQVQSKSSFGDLKKRIASVAGVAGKGVGVLTLFPILLKGLGKSGAGTFGRMESGLRRITKNFLQFGLGIRSLYYGIKKLRNIVIQEMDLMAAAIPAVNNQVSQLKTGLNQLKGSLATAFQPILSAILPALNAMISGINSALNAIARFVATLTGQKFIYKFTSATISAGSAMSGAGKAAKAAKKDLDRTLLSFDKMNKLQKNDNGGSGSGGGGGGGAGGGANGKWVKDANKTGSKLATLMKEGWKKNDFTDVGKYIGESMLRQLEILESKYIPKWDAFMTKIGKLAADTVNGFVSVDGLGGAIGSTVAQMTNIIWHTIEQFVTTLDWKALGEFAGNAIAEYINNLDITSILSTLGATLGGLTLSVVEMIATFLENTDWKAFGQKLSKGITKGVQNVHWGEILWALLRGFVGIGDALFGILEGIVDEFVEDSKRIGQGLWQGIKESIKSGASKVKEWVIDHIVTPFKNALGIHSPSTVFADIGKNCIEGLWQGIKDKMSNAKTWLKKNVLDKITGFFKSNKDKLTAEIKAKFNETKASLSKKWKNLVAGVKEVTKSISAKFADTKSKISSKWKSITGDIKDVTRSASIKISQKASDIKTKWDKLTASIQDKAKTATITLKAKASETWNNAAKKLNAARKAHPNLLGWLPNLPYLARGAVIPPNREFLAVLGDQKRGTNIETPLDTMVQAFNMALAQNGGTGGNTVKVYLEGDAKGLFRVVRTEADNYTRSTGKAAFNI